MFNQIFGGRNTYRVNIIERRLPPAYSTNDGLVTASIVSFSRYDPGLTPLLAMDMLLERLETVVTAELDRQLRRIRLTNPRADPIFVGYLFLDNHEAGRQASTRTIPVSRMRDSRILSGLIEKIVQSNQDWNPQNMELTWVYKTSQLVGGGSVLPGDKRPSYVRPIFWKTYNYRGDLPCAALSIAFYLTYYAHGTKPRDPNARITTPIKVFARQIAAEMGWYDFVSIADLQKYVEKHPEYRLTLMNDRATTSDYSSMTWIGAEFDDEGIDPESYDPPKNTIYIQLMGEVDHYVPVLHPGTLGRKKRISTNFCHKCCHLYVKKTKHGCVEKPVRPVKCVYGCGLVHEKQSDCSITRCATCARDRTRNYLDETHRCLPRTPKKPVEFDEQGLNDGKKFGLYVWDIESRLELEETAKTFKSFEIDPLTGKYVGDIEVTSHTVRKHVPILVCVQNVFTREKNMYAGLDCLQRFIDMAVTRNFGKNIFIAHNSSGYDSILLFEECCKRPNLQMQSPIFRGSKLIK